MLKRILLAAWLAAFSALPAVATTIRPLDLGQVIDLSALAFQGTVVDVKSGRDPQTGLLATLVTFRVDDVLKGDLPASYTVKQIGGEDAASGRGYRVHGVPTYTVGASYVVFMTSASSAGFSSPIGLGQGRFSIDSGEQGLEVGNGRDFRELTANVPTLDLPARAKAKAAADKPITRIGLEDFKAMVRKHTGAKR